MILIKVECGNGVVDSIKECMELSNKLQVGTTMEVNGVEVECYPWSTFDEIYKSYTEDIEGI